MAGPLHYFPVMQKDFLSNGPIRRLSLAAKGLLMSLQCHQWEDGVLPSDPREIQKLVGEVDRKVFNAAWAELAPLFAQDGDSMLYVPLNTEREKVLAKCRKNKDAADIRWGNRMNEPPDNRTQMRTHSERTSQTHPIPEPEPEPEPELPNGSSAPPRVDGQWVALGAAFQAPVSVLAMARFEAWRKSGTRLSTCPPLHEIEALGAVLEANQATPGDFAEFVDHCIGKRWATLPKDALPRWLGERDRGTYNPGGNPELPTFDEKRERNIEAALAAGAIRRREDFVG